MATPDIVPRVTGEGSIGNSAKKWLAAFITTLNATTLADGANSVTIVAVKEALDRLAVMEDNADVTDAGNVASAGAVMEADVTIALMQFVLDEDDLVSDSATKLATQQSIKAYVDGRVVSSVNFKGGYNAATNTPDLDTSPSGVTIGNMWVVTVAGTFFTIPVEVGDVLLAEIDDPTVEADWVIVNKNLDDASIKAAYENNADTNAFTDDEKTKLTGIADDANNYVHPNHSGDVTSVADGAQTIVAEAVTLAKMAHMATASLLGRDTAATGDVEVLNAATVRSLLNVEDDAAADQTNAEIETAYNAQVAEISQAEAEAGSATIRRGWTAERVKQAVNALSPATGWTTIGTGKYTATPASTSVLTMSDTSDMSVGLAIRYVDARGTHRAVIDAISANTNITIDGAPFSTSDDLTVLSLGEPEKVIQTIIDVPGAYADAADTDLNDGNDGKKHVWGLGKAYCVHFQMLHALADTGANQPRGNVRLAGNTTSVCTANTNAGLTLSTTQTFVETGIDIDVAEYEINRGDKITLTTDDNGSNNDAEDLSAFVTFVLE